MKSFNILSRAVGCVLVAIVVVSTASAETVVYREIFPHDGGASNMDGLGTANWQAHGDDGTDYTSNSSMVICLADGSPTDAAAVNSNPQYLGLAKGYIYSKNDLLIGKDVLYWTDEYGVVSTDDLVDVIFYSKNQDARDDLRVALQIKDASDVKSWYVSTTTFSSTVWQENTLDVSEATWNALTFTPTAPTALSRGASTVSLGSGTVTAFGVYTDWKYDSQRIDSFTITAVPEPSTLALLGLGGLCGLIALLRRRLKK